MLLLFVDGLGLGPDDPERNPLARLELPALEAMAGGRLVAPARGPIAVDACLDVEGLPQSGTGQTSLLTGRNAAALLGEHQGPYPGARLRELLASDSLWRKVVQAGLPATFANAFPERYLERADAASGRMGAFARSALLAGVRLRGPADLRRGRAASAFLTNAGWRSRLGYSDIATISEHQAGHNVARLAREHVFTAFEYYATDLAGHRPERLAPERALAGLDRFLAGVLSSWSEQDVLVLASDHGNIEDGSHRRHTRNPALCLWRGPAARRPLRSLTDLAPALLATMGLDRRSRREPAQVFGPAADDLGFARSPIGR